MNYCMPMELIMIMKLKNAGVNFNNNKILNDIKLEIHSKNSFITPPVKIEPIRQKDDWENKKIIEQKIALDFQNDLKKKIEFNNIKAEAIKHIDTMNMTRVHCLQCISLFFLFRKYFKHNNPFL